jgi:hypothetical protein
MIFSKTLHSLYIDINVLLKIFQAKTGEVFKKQAKFLLGDFKAN